ncbi:MAG: 30S ribosomal protein S20 [Parcubacteria group bacterium GW2011_GWA1_59_11]|nr:MAG: 30S ribosomal protein S20 [Parcubacteria group bacterium GW2011_GWA1_59_11]
MPITRSAKKALRQNVRHRELNLGRKKDLKTAVKAYRKLIAEKKTEEARAFLPKVYQVLDKTAKNNVIRKNTASRLKSRLSRLVAEAKK